MIFQRALVPYPATGAARGRIDVEVDWEGRSWIHVVFRASGFGSTIILPTGEGGRRDELWKHTCCEVFGLRTEGGYVEFNLSPSSAWAAYAFTGYRTGMADLEAPAPRISCLATEDGFELTAILYGSEWPHLEALGASVVIETTDGEKTYWALAHPSDKPDFHHPESFTLRSPALELP